MIPRRFRAGVRRQTAEVAGEVAALLLAWLATIEVRIVLNPWMKLTLYKEDLYAAAPPLSGIVFCWLAVRAWNRLRRPETGLQREWIVPKAMESALTTGLLTTAVTFFSRELGADLSRSFVLIFVPISAVFLLIAGYLSSFVDACWSRRWPDNERIAVLGYDGEACRVVEQVRRSGNGSVRVAGLIMPGGFGGQAAIQTELVLGSSDCLGELINRERLDRIVVVRGSVSETEIERCGRISNEMGVTVSRVLGAARTDVELGITEMYGLRMLELRPVAFSRWQEAVKRIFDVLVSSTTLFLLSPLFVALAVLVRISSAGPVFYISQRVGKGGRHFPFLKFRSMYLNSGRVMVAGRNEKSGHLFKVKNDPRITPVGRLMRRYSLDELPQLLNVLRGDMSLVGPRPLPAEDLDSDGKSKVFSAWSEQRSRVPPGITGLWQIRGRSELPFESMVELDVEYIRNWSLLLDLKILLETPRVVLTGAGAY